MTGGEVMRDLLAYFRILGLGNLHRQNTGMGSYVRKDGTQRRVHYGRAGDPDIAGILPDGRAFGCEAKATKELPTDAQFARILEINRSGGVAFWADDLATAQTIMPKVLEGYRVAYTSRTRCVVCPLKWPVEGEIFVWFGSNKRKAVKR